MLKHPVMCSVTVHGTEYAIRAQQSEKNPKHLRMNVFRIKRPGDQWEIPRLIDSEWFEDCLCWFHSDEVIAAVEKEVRAMNQFHEGLLG